MFGAAALVVIALAISPQSTEGKGIRHKISDEGTGSGSGGSGNGCIQLCGVEALSCTLTTSQVVGQAPVCQLSCVFKDGSAWGPRIITCP